jgi:ferritin-like metal-binding protein YciE
MSATADAARALFLQELGAMLYAERRHASDLLPLLLREVGDGDLRSGLEQHLAQTRDQAKELERAFELLGERPRERKNRAFDGLRAEHDTIARRIRADEVLDLFDCSAAVMTEHLEIASYTALVTMARRMGEPEVADLLDDICRQEQATLRRLERTAKQLGGAIATG